MILNYAEYKDKVNACWIGKNIGGTMGTPYEGKREYLDIKGFVTKKGEYCYGTMGFRKSQACAK